MRHFAFVSYNEVTKKYVRECKLCRKVLPGVEGPFVTGKALEHEGKLWLFCSLQCKLAWDTERAAVWQLEHAHDSLI